MGKIGYAALLVLVVNLTLAGAALARPVYLADGGVIEAQSVWQKDGLVEVLVNHESLVRFYPHEIDLKKTFDKKWNKPVAKKGSKAAPIAAAAAPSPSAASAAAQPTSTPPKVVPPAVETAKTVNSTSAPPLSVKPRAATPAPPPPEAGMDRDLMTALPFLVGLLVLSLLLLASFWTLFVKAGEAGWKSLIPIYNLFVLLRIAGCPLWWFLLFLVPLVNIVALILMHIRLAKQFGKGPLFGLALCFLGIIFFPLLAFGKATYGPRGPQEFEFGTV